MTNPNLETDPSVPTTTKTTPATPACVIVFNASDPSGAGGLAADVTAIASVGAHALPVVTGAYARDTAEVFDHFAFDEDAVAEQARAILEDVAVQVFKVGFVGSPENHQHDRRDRRRLRRGPADRVHAQPVVVGRRPDRRSTWTPFAN